MNRRDLNQFALGLAASGLTTGFNFASANEQKISYSGNVYQIQVKGNNMIRCQNIVILKISSNNNPTVKLEKEYMEVSKAVIIGEMNTWYAVGILNQITIQSDANLPDDIRGPVKFSLTITSNGVNTTINETNVMPIQFPKMPIPCP